MKMLALSVRLSCEMKEIFLCLWSAAYVCALHSSLFACSSSLFVGAIFEMITCVRGYVSAICFAALTILVLASWLLSVLMLLMPEWIRTASGALSASKLVMLVMQSSAFGAFLMATFIPYDFPSLSASMFLRMESCSMRTVGALASSFS